MPNPYKGYYSIIHFKILLYYTFSILFNALLPLIFIITHSKFFLKIDISSSCIVFVLRQIKQDFT